MALSRLQFAILCDLRASSGPETEDHARLPEITPLSGFAALSAAEFVFEYEVNTDVRLEFPLFPSLDCGIRASMVLVPKMRVETVRGLKKREMVYVLMSNVSRQS